MHSRAHAHICQPEYGGGFKPRRLRRLRDYALCTAVLISLGGVPALAAKRMLKLTFPLHTEFTPVQRLNYEGVDELLRHRYDKAKDYFFKAYLYDPSDPFTLVNLGYVSELEGQVDKAEKFYKLAQEQSCTATIARSNEKKLDGRPMLEALGTLRDSPMRVNRMNIMAMELLSQDRAFEAQAILKEALSVEPNDAFTLNNMGVDEEATGDLESALKYYDEAAEVHSTQPVVVTLNKVWRGKPVSDMAADSAKSLRKRMKSMDVGQIRSAMYSIRGVNALNQNDWSAAEQDFQQAYSFNPSSAFALNNLGYMAEHGGDYETAKAYYERAKSAQDAGAHVGLATRQDAEGQPLATVAEESHGNMDIDLNAYSQQQRGKKSGYMLRRRDGSVVQLNDTPKQAAPDASKTAAPAMSTTGASDTTSVSAPATSTASITPDTPQ